jgi:hypothetical protein
MSAPVLKVSALESSAGGIELTAAFVCLVASFMLLRAFVLSPEVKSKANLAGLLLACAFMAGFECTLAFPPGLLPELIRGGSLIDRALVLTQIALFLALTLAMLGHDFAASSFLFARMLLLCGVSFVFIAAAKWQTDPGQRFTRMLELSCLGLKPERPRPIGFAELVARLDAHPIAPA